MSALKNSLEMRDAYGRALKELGAANPNVVSIDADVSSSTRSVLFAKQFPERAFNVGIAELHMAAMAAGMATNGLIPFVNAFAIFLSLRSGDAVHNLIAQDNLNVKLAAAYSGYSCGLEGASHQSLNDLAILRTMPNMTVISVCDNTQTKKAVFAAAEHVGPVYLRLSRVALPDIYTEDSEFIIGKANLLREGGDVTILATGAMVWRSLEAAAILASEGIDAAVVDIHTIKPLDEQLILKQVKISGAVVTAEEHSRLGGLGGAVSELLSRKLPTLMEMVAVDDCFGESGLHHQLMEKYQLTTDDIVKKAKRVFSHKKQLV